MKKKITKPSSSELLILKALWKECPQSAKEIHTCIAEKNNWSYSSTRKTLDRMMDKQFITVSLCHGIRVFKPKLKKLSTLALYIKDFTTTILELKTPLPVSMFVESDLLNEAELLELEKLLKNEKKK